MRTPLQKGEKILLVTYSSWTTLIMPVLVGLLCVAAAILIVIKTSSPWGWLAAVLGIGYYAIKYFNL